MYCEIKTPTTMTTKRAYQHPVSLTINLDPTTPLCQISAGADGGYADISDGYGQEQLSGRRGTWSDFEAEEAE